MDMGYGGYGETHAGRVTQAIHSAKEREESGATLSIGTTELIVEWPCDITGMEVGTGL